MAGNFNLTRFTEVQEKTYQSALSEIKSEMKTGHWMWYIFPQIAGLGYSETSKFYAIKNLDEAKAYLNDPILGVRIREISSALLMQPASSARQIFGSPDDLKLHSCMTLFAIADEENKDNVFEKVLQKFFQGKYDKNTVEILEEQS